MEGDHSLVGDHDQDASLSYGTETEPDVAGEYRSDDHSEREGQDGEGSVHWIETRSRVTTPDSSTPSPPRR